MSGAPTGKVVAVVPIKHLGQAKTRLALPAALRRELALAFARDTLAAVAAAVGAVVVVSGDPDLGELLPVPRGESCRLVADPGTGLVGAVGAGQRFAFQQLRARRVVVVPADLPALTAAALTEVLAAVPWHQSAFVPDMSGRGTSLLLTGSPDALPPQYGPGSARLHRERGATSLATAPAAARQDVDDLDDLAAAVELGVGPATRCALREAGGLIGGAGAGDPAGLGVRRSPAPRVRQPS